MDPDAALVLILDGLRKLRREPENSEARQEVIAYLRYLTSWLEIRGFAPDVEAACRSAMS